MSIPAELRAALHTSADLSALSSDGRVFAVFDAQDSGHLSYGVHHDGARWFVKTADTPATVRALRSAALLHAAVTHPAIVPQLALVDLPGGGLAGVYPWVDGQVLYPMPKRPRTDPAHPLARFRAMPVPRVLDALDTLLDAHLAITDIGYVAVDFYDGSIIYDFERHQVHLIDLDAYRPAPATRTAIWFGSRRFMAPEEHVPGAVIDERTTVYTLGRTLRLLLDAGDSEQGWRGSHEQLAIVRTATMPQPAHRYDSVAALAAAWRRATDRAVGLFGQGDDRVDLD